MLQKFRSALPPRGQHSKRITNKEPQIGEIRMSKYGDFYAIKEHGFPKANWKDHQPSPKQFQPAYLSSPDFQKKGYHVEELVDGVYWVTNGGYDAAFVCTGKGVIAIDAPPSLGENMLAAIEEVSDEPI